MQPYDPIRGVPIASYYLIEITQFADFEVDQQERILFTSRDKQELIDLCKYNSWGYESPGGWSTHYIKFKIL